MSSSESSILLRPGRPGYHAVSAALFLTGLITFALLYSTQPILPVLAQDFHLGAAAVSLTVSFGTAGLALGLPVWSTWSDRHGRRPAIVFGLVLSSLLTLALPAASNFWWLAILRLVQGFAVAGVPATAMTYLGEEISPIALGSAMGLYISGNSLGGMSGRIAVGLTADALGWRIALFVLGLLALSLSLIAIGLLPRSRGFTQGRRSLRQQALRFGALLARPDLRRLFFIGGLLMAAFVAMYNYLGFLLVSPAYGLRLGTSSLVYLFYLVGTLSSYLMGSLADRLGRSRILQFSVLLTMLGALITLAAPLPLKLLGLGVFTFGFFGGHSSASTLVSLRAKEERGAASTLYLLTYYLGSSIGGSAIGVLWQALAWPGVVLGIAVALAPAVFLARSVLRQEDVGDALGLTPTE